MKTTIEIEISQEGIEAVCDILHEFIKDEKSIGELKFAAGIISGHDHVNRQIALVEAENFLLKLEMQKDKY